jgi:hypothetical protein
VEQESARGTRSTLDRLETSLTETVRTGTIGEGASRVLSTAKVWTAWKSSLPGPGGSRGEKSSPRRNAVSATRAMEPGGGSTYERGRTKYRSPQAGCRQATRAGEHVPPPRFSVSPITTRIGRVLMVMEWNQGSMVADRPLPVRKQTILGL